MVADVQRGSRFGGIPRWVGWKEGGRDGWMDARLGLLQVHKAMVGLWRAARADEGGKENGSLLFTVMTWRYSLRN